MEVQIKRVLRPAAFLVALAMIPLASVQAEVVGRGTFRVEGDSTFNAYCVLITWNDLPLTVFGTPVNLGTSAESTFCTGSTVPINAGHCDSRPDGSQLVYDYDVLSTAGLPSQSGFAFVTSGYNLSGALPTAIAADTMTGDGVAGGTLPLVAPTIPGCTPTANVYFEGALNLNAFRTTPTSTGTDVTVSANPSYLNPTTNNVENISIDVTFANVSVAGGTTVTAVSSVAGALPSNFSLDVGGYHPSFFDVSTDATITPPITICQHYADTDSDGVVDGTTVSEDLLTLLHGEGSPLAFVDRTVSRDPLNNVICAEVSSLSPFVVAADTPVNHDSVVLPGKPVSIVIPSSGTSITKVLKVQVQNGDPLETAGHDIRLAVSQSTCPASLLQDAANQPVSPDFDTASAVTGDTATVLGGHKASAKIRLRAVAVDYTSLNAKSPRRCSITFTATSLDSAPVAEINPSNNSTTVEIDVVDKSDF